MRSRGQVSRDVWRVLRCVARSKKRRKVIATRDKVGNKVLEIKGNAEVRVEKAVGKAIQAKGLVDQVESDLKNAGKDLKKVARRIQKATKKGN